MNTVTFKDNGQTFTLAQLGPDTGTLDAVGKTYQLSNVKRSGSVVTADLPRFLWDTPKVAFEVRPDAVRVTVTDAGPENRDNTYALSSAEFGQLLAFIGGYPDAGA